MILVFWMLSFKPTLSLSSFTFIRGRVFSSSSLSAIQAPLPEGNLLTPVFLWEGASHTQFRMENSLGTVGSPWVWAELSEASPPRSSQSLWSTWRVSLRVQLVHSTVSEPWAYVQCAVSIWCLKLCLLVVTKSATKAGPLPDSMLVGNPNLGTISLSRHQVTFDALSVWVKSFYPSRERTYHDQLVTVVSVRFHFSEVHSQVFKGQRAFQLNTRRFLSEYPRGSIDLWAGSMA